MDHLDKALAEHDRRSLRRAAMQFAVAFLITFVIFHWGVPFFWPEHPRHIDTLTVPVLICGPFCEVDVAPEGEHQLRASCICPSSH